MQAWPERLKDARVRPNDLVVKIRHLWCFDANNKRVANRLRRFIPTELVTVVIVDVEGGVT